MAGINDLIQQQGNPNIPGVAPMGPMPPMGLPTGPGTTPGMPNNPPPLPGGIPPDQGQKLATPEQLAELKRLDATVKMANSKLVGKNLMDRNQVNLARKQMMQQLFSLMQQAGVDPSNPASIRSFLEQLGQQDPDLLQIFEDAFHGVMDNPSVPTQGAGALDEGSADQSADQGPEQTEPTAQDNPIQDRFAALNRMGANQPPQQ